MKTPAGPASPSVPAAAERADVDALGPAVHGVRARVAGLSQHLLRLDDLDDRRLGRIGLRVDDIDARRADAGNDQIAALEERMARERRQSRTAGVPAEVMELVAHDSACRADRWPCQSWRARVDIDDRERVGLRAVRRQEHGVGQLLGGRFARDPRRWVEGRIGA